MRIGEKFQSNPEIAGSPRNSFRASLRRSHTEVGRWIPAGASKPTNGYQTANAVVVYLGVRLYEISWIAKRETARTRS